MSDKDFKWLRSTAREGWHFTLSVSTAPVHAHVHTHTHRAQSEVWRVSVWSWWKVAVFQMRKQAKQIRWSLRGLRVRFLLVRRCVVSCSVIQFTGTGVTANKVPLVDSVISLEIKLSHLGKCIHTGTRGRRERVQRLRVAQRGCKVGFQSKTDLSHWKNTQQNRSTMTNHLRHIKHYSGPSAWNLKLRQTHSPFGSEYNRSGDFIKCQDFSQQRLFYALQI